MISRIDRRPRKNGKVSWRVRVWKGYDADGRPVKDSVTFRSKGEAEEYVQGLNAARTDQPAAAVLTVSGYLDQWLATVESTRTYATHRRYRIAVAPIREAVGTVRLDKLTAAALEAVYARLYERLSARTVIETHGAIRAALNRAVKQKLILVNPALACTLRPSDTGEAQVLDGAQLAKLETAAADSWASLAIRLAADTGARRGELAALRWDDLDAVGRIRIWQTVFEKDDGELVLKPTKTRSERRVALSPATLAYLNAHREQQRRNAALMGSPYRSDLDLILAAPDGEFLRPQTLTKAVRRIADNAGLTGAGLHTLRHSHATLLLSSGAPLAAVSKRLGHRDTHTTARIYSHALPSDEERLATMWETIRGGESSPKMGKNGEPAPERPKSGRKPRTK